MRVMPSGREDNSSVERCRWEEKPVGIAAADGEREMMPRGIIQLERDASRRRKLCI